MVNVLFGVIIVRGFLVIRISYSALAVHRRMIILREWLIQLEEANQTRYDNREEAEELLERSQTEDQWQKQE